MCAEPLIENRCGIAIWIELFFCRHEVGQVFALVPVSIANGPSLRQQILKHSRVVFFRLLQPEPRSSGHRGLSVPLGSPSTGAGTQCSASPAKPSIPCHRQKQTREAFVGVPVPSVPIP